MCFFVFVFCFFCFCFVLFCFVLFLFLFLFCFVLFLGVERPVFKIRKSSTACIETPDSCGRAAMKIKIKQLTVGTILSPKNNGVSTTVSHSRENWKDFTGQKLNVQTTNIQHNKYVLKEKMNVIPFNVIDERKILGMHSENSKMANNIENN